MALQKNYVIGDTGIEVPDAYHIIYNVYTERRLNNCIQPKLPAGMPARPEISWKAGHVGRIAVFVYANKSDRDNGLRPIGAIVKYPSDASDRETGFIDQSLYSITPPFQLEFFIDDTSSDSILTQAYNYLKTIPYFSGSLEI
jgi:hypothetical protein